MSVSVDLNDLTIWYRPTLDADAEEIDFSHLTINKNEELITIVPADGSPAITARFNEPGLKLELP